MRTNVGDWIAAGILTVAITAVHFNSPIVTISDATWNLFTSFSILESGDTDLNEFEAFLKERDYWGIHRAGDRLLNYFPIGPSLFALPFLAASKQLPGGWMFFNLHGWTERDATGNWQIFIASCSVAFSGGLFYIIARRFGLRWLPALAITLLFAFGTSLYSTASRALWQHGPSVVVLCATLLAFQKLDWLDRVRDRGWHAGNAAFYGLLVVTGLLLGMAYLMRPTNAIPAVLLSGFVLVRYRLGVVPFLIGTALIAGPYLAYNQAIYADWFPPYSQASRVGGWNSFWTALPANLFSPARGLLVFSPIVGLSVVGLILLLRQGRLRLFELTLLACMLLHVLVISRFEHWWLGHSYGPRGMTDILPFLFWFLLPVLGAVDFAGRARTAGRMVLLALLTITGLWSVDVHWRGANKVSVLFWNVHPVNVDAHPERIHDWSDPLFLRDRARYLRNPTSAGLAVSMRCTAVFRWILLLHPFRSTRPSDCCPISNATRPCRTSRFR